MKKIALLVGLVALFAGGNVQAAPDSVSFAGRLSTAGGPVNGNVSVTFTVFDAATGGSAAWTDTIALTADQGLVFAQLGRAANPLDEAVFGGAPMFLEIVVQGETLSPRLPINSTPYAVRSSGADSADLLGTLAPGDVVTTVTAGTGLTGGGSGNMVSLSIDTSVTQARITGSCAGANQSIKTVDAGGGVTCETDDNTVYTGGAGINVSGTTVALTTCPVNQVLKSTGAGYSCQVDVDTNTTYTGGAGISVTGTTVALTTCAAGQILKSTGAGYSCQADNNTTYTQSTGISINASNQIAVDSAIVARKDAAAGNQAFDTSTLVLDYALNRVGVGTAAPTLPLDVAGAMRATSINVAAAQTGYYNQPGHAFSPDTSTGAATWNVNVGYGNLQTGTSMSLGAQVALPDGVTINQFNCYRYDNDATNNVSGTLTLYRRAYLSTTITSLGSVSIATSVQSANPQEATVAVTANNIVDNDLYQYFMYGSFGNTPALDTALRFYGCRVRYTWTQVRF